MKPLVCRATFGHIFRKASPNRIYIKYLPRDRGLHGALVAPIDNRAATFSMAGAMLGPETLVNGQRLFDYCCCIPIRAPHDPHRERLVSDQKEKTGIAMIERDTQGLPIRNRTEVPVLVLPEWLDQRHVRGHRGYDDFRGHQHLQRLGWQNGRLCELQDPGQRTLLDSAQWSCYYEGSPEIDRDTTGIGDLSDEKNYSWT